MILLTTKIMGGGNVAETFDDYIQFLNDLSVSLIMRKIPDDGRKTLQIL